MKRISTTLITCIALIVASTVYSENDKARTMYGQKNAIFAGSIFLRGHDASTKKLLDDKDIKLFASVLKKNNIKYAYLFAGPFSKTGDLPEYPFTSLARENLSKLKQYYPELILLPWIGGIQNKQVFLNDKNWTSNAVNSIKKLIDYLPVDGILLDFEYMLIKEKGLIKGTREREKIWREEYGNNLNLFHRMVREKLPDIFIATVVTSTAPGTKPWKYSEIRQLSEYVNQMSFLYYDTNIHDENEFIANLNYQIADLKKLKKEINNKKIQYLIALGTFENQKNLRKYRDMRYENIPYTLKQLKYAILQNTEKTRLVDGITIYCFWETDEKEWQELYTYWLNGNI